MGRLDFDVCRLSHFSIFGEQRALEEEEDDRTRASLRVLSTLVYAYVARRFFLFARG